MGITTAIEWCDSTVNAQMGCDGCELWNKKTGEGTCYAATLTERYGGRNGWPKSFGEPAIFPDRIAKACAWPDLTGTERPDKPWLNGYPRMNFLDDMGDTFTESLPRDWLAPYIPQMAAASCIWMMLTKRARRMRRFWESYGPAPANFWLMVSVTSRQTLARVDDLIRTPGGGARLVSYEPMLEAADFCRYLRFDPDLDEQPIAVDWPCEDCGEPVERGINWESCGCCGSPEPTSDHALIDGIIFGGESGPGARTTDIALIRSGVTACRESGVAAFVKQLGAHAYETMESFEQLGTDGALANLSATGDTGGRHITGWTLTHTPDGKSRYYRHLKLRDPKGGNWNEWSEDLRVRELPRATHA